jgi:drug/metabolite transporter (DMT)-like permease
MSKRVKINFPSVPNTVTPKEKLYGIGFMVLSSFFWAALELTGHYLPANYGSYQTVWVRYGVHLLFMLLLFGPRQQTRTQLVHTKFLKLQLARPLLMIGMPLCYIIGLNYIPWRDMWGAFWISPLMAIGLAQLILGEKVGRYQWFLAVVGFGGALLFYEPSANLLSWHIIFPLGMAFCYGLYSVMTRMLRTDGTITNLFYTALVVFVPWSLGFFQFWQPLTFQAMAVMTAFGLLGYASLYFLDKAYGEAPISDVVIIRYTQVIFIIILSSFITGHFPGYRAILSSLILLGVGLLAPIAFELHLPQQIANYFADIL